MQSISLSPSNYVSAARMCIIQACSVHSVSMYSNLYKYESYRCAKRRAWARCLYILSLYTMLRTCVKGAIQYKVCIRSVVCTGEAGRGA